MQLVKEERYTELNGELTYDELIELIGSMIDYYAVTFVPRDNWCTKQERIFFIACIIISNRGLRYTSKEAFTIFKDVFNLRRQSDIRGMLNRLEENNWLESDVKNKKIYLLEFFKFNLSDHEVRFDIKLKFKK